MLERAKHANISTTNIKRPPGRFLFGFRYREYVHHKYDLPPGRFLFFPDAGSPVHASVALSAINK